MLSGLLIDILYIVLYANQGSILDSFDLTLDRHQFNSFLVVKWMFILDLFLKFYVILSCI